MGDRPWVKVVEIKPRGTQSILSLSFQHLGQFGNFAGVEYQATLNYEIHLKIIGRSPALNIDISPELYLPIWNTVLTQGYSGDVVSEEKRFCDEVARRKKEIKNGGTASFPDETPTIYVGAATYIYERNKNRSADVSGEYILPVLIGCVDYQFQSSEIHHQTRFVCETFHANEPRTRFFTVGSDVSANDMTLIRNESDDYAY